MTSPDVFHRVLGAVEAAEIPCAALEALRIESQFNVLDLTTGWKIDLIVRKSRPFSRTEFDRRITAEIEGLRIPIASAEDIVLAKLEWAKLGWIRDLGLERQWETADRKSRM
jgi:hypothetical protein